MISPLTVQFNKLNAVLQSPVSRANGHRKSQADSFTQSKASVARFGAIPEDTLAKRAEKCDQLNKHNPQWFMIQALAEGIQAYYTQLDTFLTSAAEKKSQAATQLVIPATPEMPVAAEDMAAQLEAEKKKQETLEGATMSFSALKQHPLIQAIVRPDLQVAPGKQNFDVLFADQFQEQAEKLYELLETLNPYIQAHEEEAAKAQKRILPVSTPPHPPSWYAGKGVAQALSKFFNTLEGVVYGNPFFKGLNRTEGQGSLISSEPSKLTTFNFSDLEKIETLQKQFDPIRAQSPFNELKLYPGDKQVEMLHSAVEKDFDAKRTLADKLHQMMLPLADLIETA